MSEDKELIQELEIEHLTPEEQRHVIDEVHMQIGEALAEKLSPAQLEEFQQIIDGNEKVITAWLAENIPDYQETDAFKQIDMGTGEGPDHVPADKIYAYLAWVELNNPGYEEAVAKIKVHIKANIDSYK